MSVVQVGEILLGQEICIQENLTFVSANPTHPKACILTNQQQVAINGAGCSHSFIPDDSIKTSYNKGYFKMCDICNILLELDNIKIHKIIVQCLQKKEFQLWKQPKFIPVKNVVQIYVKNVITKCKKIFFYI